MEAWKLERNKGQKDISLNCLVIEDTDLSQSNLDGMWDQKERWKNSQNI